ncbi:ABC transporter ATP-binding protein [Canibacter sp. lx-45]|uniref:ABC transporter ATP-binding protein n=1 Tax=Canibacter zhuwentaonis TaxID=2837491 RepID=UPI001BDC3428|nr:ABC transporter ATP-binding protein [Canibacter zhuwentaonis]MBT1035948.1 ABC transporter ATP-binding protein [Canibacter zhuwentaonis]
MNDIDIIRVTNLRKSYQGRQVLQGVDIRLMRGGAYFLVGPNGCGKTTTIETLIGLRRIESGEVVILGIKPHDPALRSKIRVCLQGASLHAQVTVGEHLSFIAALYGEGKSQVTQVAEQFQIADLLSRRFGRLSGGQQKRVMVASALFGESDLIVLDEPTSGVDLESRFSLWASLREAIAARGTTLLATTHDLTEAEEYASEVIIMREGRVYASGGVHELIAQSGLAGVLLVPTGAVSELLGDAAQQSAVSATKEGATVASRRVLSADSATTTFGYTDPRLLSTDKQRLQQRGIAVYERAPRLKDAYLLTDRRSAT